MISNKLDVLDLNLVISQSQPVDCKQRLVLPT